VKSLLEFFPFEPRGNQREILEELEGHLKNPDVRFIIIQGPTGVGKSPIGIAAARYVKNAYILTVNKVLQDQYLRDFEDKMKDLRGRANYECYEHPGFNCGNSPCRRTQEKRKECSENCACEYHEVIAEAIKSPITSLNFAAALAYLNHHISFIMEGGRELLIVDEAHAIQSQLTNFIEISFSDKKLRNWGLLQKKETIPIFESPEAYLSWFQLISERLSKMPKGKELDPRDFEEIENLQRRLTKMRVELEKDSDNFILDHVYYDNDPSQGITKLVFRPLDVSKFAYQYLFSKAEKVILMSATILDYKTFLRTLGIPEDKSVYMDISSTFPVENRKIQKRYVGSLNFRNIRSLMPSICVQILKVMRMHPNEKGIIHTQSYQNALDVMDYLKGKDDGRLLFPQNAREQKEILQKHAETDQPTVLISPSMTEGVDLKDELSRFQILMKVPFPSLGDKVVKARMKLDNSWYTWQTMLTIVQASGRSIRSETDKAATYVLDKNFDRVISQSKGFLPKWFLDAID
jgi:Rad3-related DNA helicase